MLQPICENPSPHGAPGCVGELSPPLDPHRKDLEPLWTYTWCVKQKHAKTGNVTAEETHRRDFVVDLCVKED